MDSIAALMISIVLYVLACIFVRNEYQQGEQAGSRAKSLDIPLRSEQKISWQKDDLTSSPINNPPQHTNSLVDIKPNTTN
jgi:hypothetical protein